MVMRVPRGDVAAPLREAERVAWSLSPFTNVYAVGRLSDQLADLNWRPRFGAAVLGGFAIIVFVLAALGLYAVIAYTVAQQRREIGVRMALGGTPGVIVRNVVGSAMGLAAVGIVAGNMLAVAFARSLRGLLFGVAPTDAPTFAVASAAMLLVALGASAIPALAAARVNPIEAIREP
jgi:ABC-type antimicrobial peptide transport system permease subunit